MMYIAPRFPEWTGKNYNDEIHWKATCCAAIEKGRCTCPKGLKKCGAVDGYTGHCIAQTKKRHDTTTIDNRFLYYH